MKSIAVVIPYFGKFPNYFNLWLKTASYNKTIDFYLVTDNTLVESTLPDNIFLVDYTFENLKKKIKSLFPFPIRIDYPYKLCDFKPFYGIIFSDIVKDYDFWGHCDLDIIWGNIRKFITDDVLKANDKVYTWGHFSLYRNTAEINFRLLDGNKGNSPSPQEVLSSPLSYHYDEWGG